MNKAFEKILERLILESSSCEIYKLINPNKENIAEFNTYKKCIEIVKEVAEKYNGGWISVKDRLPDKAGSYLVIGKSGGATVTRWYMPSEFYPEGHFGGNSTDYIRYWMPRPEPPKERD